MQNQCFQCAKSDEETPLQMCKVCQKYFCEDHAVQRSGVAFCSLGCGVFFFHGDGDDDDDE